MYMYTCNMTKMSFGLNLSVTFISISAAVRLVVSKFSTRAVSPKKFPPAEESLDRRESSSSFSLILNSFC